jgi:hypothetical protein
MPDSGDQGLHFLHLYEKYIKKLMGMVLRIRGEIMGLLRKTRDEN